VAAIEIRAYRYFTVRLAARTDAHLGPQEAAMMDVIVKSSEPTAVRIDGGRIAQ